MSAHQYLNPANNKSAGNGTNSNNTYDNTTIDNSTNDNSSSTNNYTKAFEKMAQDYVDQFKTTQEI